MSDRTVPPDAPLLSGVVVHWGDPAELRDLVAAWPEDGRFELLVVDNGPGPGAQVRELVGTKGRVVRPERNLGFGGGANRGAREARGEVVLVLNPDVVPEPGALDELAEGFRRHPEAAGLVPRMVGRDGEAQFAWQLRRLPSATELLLQAAGWPTAPEAREEPAEGEPVEQPAAAALALRRGAFDAVGGFDPGFFPAWFEDVDLAQRLRERGMEVRYWPRATVRHGLGGTVGQLGYGRFLWTYQRNLVRYLEKHHGAVAATTARLLLPAGLLLRLALLPVRKPRRAATRAAAARGLAGALAGAATGWRRPRRWAGDGATDRAGEPAGGSRSGAGHGEPAGGDGPQDPGQRVTVCIVTRDSEADVAECFAAVAALHHRPLEVVLVDCGSRDGTVAAAQEHRGVLEAAGVALRLRPLGENRGFAGGMNAALELSTAPWVLSLNADARPAPDYLGRLLHRAAAHPELRVAGLTGRLTRLPAEETPAAPPVLDACGMRLTRTWRHLDRGSGEMDEGQYARPERVFGATGAASLFRRAALDDAALEGDAFDPLFHSFREDAELAFRLRERGWEVLYEPTARAGHRRFNLPERRRAMPPAVNRHSLKNRYLLRLYHQTPRNLLVTLLPTLLRDLAALGYALLRERSSLPAYGWLWRHRREVLARRRAVQGRRTVAARELDRWFGREGMPL